MNLAPLLQYLPLIISAGPSVKAALDEARSNDDGVTKIKKIAPTLAPILEQIGSMWFPKAAGTIHIVAAATAAYDQNITKWVQGACNSIVGANLKVDGIYGPNTRAAVELLQTHLGLTVDGYAGQLTQAAIGIALSKL